MTVGGPLFLLASAPVVDGCRNEVCDDCIRPFWLAPIPAAQMDDYEDQGQIIRAYCVTCAMTRFGVGMVQQWAQNLGSERREA